MKMCQGVFIGDKVGHVGVLPCLRPEDRSKTIAVSKHYRPIANLEEGSSFRRFPGKILLC